MFPGVNIIRIPSGMAIGFITITYTVNVIVTITWQSILYDLYFVMGTFINSFTNFFFLTYYNSIMMPLKGNIEMTMK